MIIMVVVVAWPLEIGVVGDLNRDEEDVVCLTGILFGSFERA